MRKVFLILAITVMLSACGGSGFEQRVVIPEAKWSVEHRIPFDVTVNDTLGIYAFGLSLRHLENYRYSNLYATGSIETALKRPSMNFVLSLTYTST